ncbi:YciI family protein [Exiguobacterium flavidum]|uniref:YciI family protein n=1 Tax=Exiguobacterium flavidum TaxID=2184695 RepID=UPI0013003863|nr:YciI family protein [Exiguobacterium flavidum]
MRYVCLGFFNPSKMNVLPKKDVDAIMEECQIHLETLQKTDRLLLDTGVEQEMNILRLVDGKIRVENIQPGERERMLGSVFMLEAQDMEDAIRTASLHPTVQVSRGEKLDWEIEIHPIHHFEMKQSSVPSNDS